MRILAVVMIWLAATCPAFAQDWQDFRDADMGFSAAFPGMPTVSDTVYKLADGSSVKAKLYALKQGGNEYRIIVADFTDAALQDNAAIDQAAKTLSATGKVAFDIQARVNQNYGRQLSVTSPDGSRSVSAIFFVNHRLYQIEGIVHPGDDAVSSYAARFQQSLNFLGGGRGGFGGGRGPGGRGPGGRGFGRGAPPP